ncbi:MAG: tetratricopeptide repeat protein [Planctomycetota bacterium]
MHPRSTTLRFLVAGGRPLACVLVILATTGAMQAADSVVLTDGERLSGSIVSLAPDFVEIEGRDGAVSKIAISGVWEVALDGEPESLASARTLLGRQDGSGALAELDKIEKAELDAADPQIRDEYDFLKAAATARAAAAGDGPAAAAGLQAFLTAKPRSHHRFKGHEILGDLFARLGKFDDAVAAYAELDRGPPALRVRAATIKARLLLQQNKPAEAIKEFEVATKIPTDPADAASSLEKGEAQLGIARCLARTGKAEDGIKAARAIILEADPNDRVLLGKAFATLGECQRAAGGKDQDALISYLTVDLVYNSVPEPHAEALYNLVQLWDATKQPERARAARQALLAAYPESQWAKQLGDGQAS